MDPMRNSGRVFTLSRFAIYFEMVAQAGSIRQAANVLNVSPSAVNRQILAVEQEMGTLLFHRHSTGLSLTSAGELLLATIRGGKRDFEAFQARLSALSGLHGGLVTMAVVEAVSDRFIPDILSEISKDYPRVEFSVKTMDFKSIWQSVSRNEVDFGISLLDSEKSSRRVRVVSTLQAPIGFVVRPDHPLAAWKETRLTHVLGSRLIVPDATLAVGAAIREGLLTQNVEIKPAFSCNRIVSIKALVRSGLGVALLTQADVIDEEKSGELCFVRITQSDIKPLCFALTHNTQRQLSAAAHATLDLISRNFHALSMADAASSHPDTMP
ncbi:hypothetical protein AD947_16365 [Acetobacter tropicalis]|uniref:HTH lysR-type domain-containing protein n=1 Tax=Acetobacter tropicalis TaxID=104102 RepID=A0A149TQP2_9PROT|nr:LysR family transcriptional regulator [Acetobacter tropicalis]KXV55461.1 hypothetical protein AD947_16365 [Acetobacter tropicalis]